MDSQSSSVLNAEGVVSRLVLAAISFKPGQLTQRDGVSRRRCIEKHGKLAYVATIDDDRGSNRLNMLPPQCLHNIYETQVTI
jgi:hypothetical protein